MCPRRFAIVALIALVSTTPQPLAPAVITVEDACNLPAAMAAANQDSSVGACSGGSGADTIRLTEAVVLTVWDNHADGPNGTPSVTSKITIDGRGYGVARDFVSAPEFRIFHVAESGELHLEDLSLSFGLVEGGENGAGIYNAGVLTLRNSTVSLNTVRTNATYNSYGGGIFNEGEALLYESRVTSNTADSEDGLAGGGGIFTADDSSLQIFGSTIEGNNTTGHRGQGGGLFKASSASLTIHGSTIAMNSATGAHRNAGGGLNARGALAITNTTVSGNTAATGLLYGEGGGAYVNGVGVFEHVTFSGNEAYFGAALYGNAGVTVVGSLFANSTGPHCGGPIVDGGDGNLADDDTCTSTIAGTLTGLDGALADNGGPTETHALLSGSTAIGIAGNCDPAVDQRGAARPTPCDSGAFERADCALLELDDRVIDALVIEISCHSALLGPDLVVGSSGDLRVTAGHLVTIKDDFVVEAGGSLIVGVDP
jgi:hypothetical protein